MNKKNILCLLLVLVISGCTNQGNSKKEVESLNKTINTLETKVETLEEENASLGDEVNTLKKSFDNYEYDEAMSFKDVVEIRVKILQKQEGDDLYPYYIIATQEDRDHNTPLLITVDNASIYDKFDVGSVYDINVHVEAVVDRNNNVIRFMYSLSS